jgi:hypothetical protein
MTDQTSLAADTGTPIVEPTGLTTFFVFTVNDDLTVYTLVKTVLARDRDHALRRAFGKEPPLSVAVSEHAFRVKRPRFVQVVDGMEDVQIPIGGPPALAIDGVDPDHDGA